MNISDNKPYMIFVKEYQGKKFYKVGLSKKNQNGQYENGYVDIRFKGGADLENQTQIYIKKAFLSFYKSQDKHTIPYIQVMEWETVSETIKESKKPEVVKQNDNDDLFAEFGEEHKDDELYNLPF